jgi:hypothetical protein
LKEFVNAILPLPIPYQLVIGALASLVIACVSIAGRNYIKASEEFRNAIYTCLEGIYPEVVTYISTDEKTTRTQNSINPINTAGVKFQHFLPFFCIGSFKKALTHYCETARKTNWHDQAARDMFNNTKFEGANPRDEFIKAVDTLLKFAK